MDGLPRTTVPKCGRGAQKVAKSPAKGKSRVGIHAACWQTRREIFGHFSFWQGKMVKETPFLHRGTHSHNQRCFLAERESVKRQSLQPEGTRAELVLGSRGTTGSSATATVMDHRPILLFRSGLALNYKCRTRNESAESETGPDGSNTLFYWLEPFLAHCSRREAVCACLDRALSIPNTSDLLRIPRPPFLLERAKYSPRVTWRFPAKGERNARLMGSFLTDDVLNIFR